MIKGMDHVGISVANLERSLHFYGELLGMNVLAVETFAGAQYEAILALDGATGKVALLKRGSLQIELFEFAQPSPAALDPERPVCHHGITHFCFEVSDIDGEYARLKTAGVPFHCAPLLFGDSTKATYGRDPDGNVFEMFETLGLG